MQRISKSDPLAAVARAITQRNLKQVVDAVPATQKGLVDLFLKLVGPQLDGAEVTAKDVGRAIAQARAQLVAKYKLDEDAPTKGEVEQAGSIGRRASDLAKALKAAAT